jgi:hypothetical protein
MFTTLWEDELIKIVQAEETPMNIDLGGNTLTDGYFAGIVIGPSANTSWIVEASAYTSAAGNMIQADTRGGAFTITLPATASVGDAILIQDATLAWNTNNLTIARNGLNINGGTSNYVASLAGSKLTIVYISSSYGWSIK